MDFDSAVAAIAKELEARMVAAGVSTTPFPARRHDESGWLIGSVVDGVVLTEQIYIEIPPDKWELADEHLNAFVARLVSQRARISALLGRIPEGWQYVQLCLCGFRVRFLHRRDNGCMRLDVLVG